MINGTCGANVDTTIPMRPAQCVVDNLDNRLPTADFDNMLTAAAKGSDSTNTSLPYFQASSRYDLKLFDSYIILLSSSLGLARSEHSKLKHGSKDNISFISSIETVRELDLPLNLKYSMTILHSMNPFSKLIEINHASMSDFSWIK